jgi:hypothetical protein
LIAAVRERLLTISIPVYSAARRFVGNISIVPVSGITEAQVRLMVVTAWKFRRQMGALAPPEAVAMECKRWLAGRLERKAGEASAKRAALRAGTLARKEGAGGPRLI